jgi:mannose-1-phosphate guanylyltransferase
MDPSRLVALIMAGGGGTRFWPRSRRARPKQFLRFSGEDSLLRATIRRLEGLVPPERTLLITGADQVSLAREHSGLPASSIIGEPEKRDTAACIGLGALLAAKIRPDAVLVVLASDHLIDPAEGFRASITRAAELAVEHGAIVTLGLRPDRPATGFGYIEFGKRLDETKPAGFQVAAFHEKPDAETAGIFLRAGTFLWNSGIFVFTVPVILDAIKTHMPELHAGLMSIRDPRNPEDVRRVYPGLVKKSIDYGILEHAKNQIVVEAAFQWDDVGTFEALGRYLKPDKNGNLARGGAIALDARNNLVDNDAKGTVVLSGVSDLLVVRTDDVVLVVPRKHAEKIKDIVDQLHREGRADVL